MKKLLICSILAAVIPAAASAQETPRPNIDVPRPNTDVPRPNVDVPRPNVDVPRPNVDVPRTGTDTGVRGPAEIQRPRMETATGSILPSRPRGN